MQLNDLLLEKLIKYPESVYEKFDKIMDKMEDNRLADKIEEEINGKV